MKIALAVQIFTEDIVNILFEYFDNDFSNDADLFLFVKEDTLVKIENDSLLILKKFFINVKIILFDRTSSLLLLLISEIGLDLLDYDYICRIQEEVLDCVSNQYPKKQFQYCLSNIWGSKKEQKSWINEFEENRNLGFLGPNAFLARASVKDDNDLELMLDQFGINRQRNDIFILSDKNYWFRPESIKYLIYQFSNEAKEYENINSYFVSIEKCLCPTAEPLNL